MSNYRRVARIVEGQPASDGAGVELRRIIGTPQCDHVDPFLLLDEFRNDQPDAYIAGFPPHPHRGFETVTYMLHGRMRHEDSVGNSGLLSDGAVQWITAGPGIIHSEMPEQSAGMMWGYQLWVNLPADLKMVPPRYQDIPGETIPEHTGDGIRVRVVAGDYDGMAGIADTHFPVNYLDVHLDAGREFALPLPDGQTALAYLYQGAVAATDNLDRAIAVSDGQLAVFECDGAVRLAAGDDGARFLFLAAQPIGEPVARMGLFVMNTRAELIEAVNDYQNGTLT